MSSIIYIDPNKRNRLVRAWREQIFEMAERLENLKKEAENLKEIDLKEEIEYELKKFKDEFNIVFSGASNDEIVRRFDIKYWDADKVDSRLRTISEGINQLEFQIREKIFEKQEILQKQADKLREKIYKYEFLNYLSSDLENLESLSIENLRKKIENIENEISTKISVYNKVKNTKHFLKETIKEIKNNINQYSFLKEFNNGLNTLELKLADVKGIEIEQLNEIMQQFNQIKIKIEEKESMVLNGIESIKEYQILQEEIKEIDNVINNLTLKSKTKQIEKEKLQKQYNKFLEKLKNYSLKESERIEKLDLPLETKLFELKLTYSKEKKRYLIFSKFEEIKKRYKEDNEFFEKFSLRIENVIKNNKEYEFYNLLYDIENYESKKKVIKQQISILKEKLQELGYSFENEIKLGEIGYLNTEKKEYKIKYIFYENGEVGFNFVRTGNLKNLNSYEKAKTIEKAKKWCSDFDKLNENMKKEGIELNIELREEPTIDDIIFEELEIEETQERKETITQERYLGE